MDVCRSDGMALASRLRPCLETAIADTCAPAHSHTLTRHAHTGASRHAQWIHGGGMTVGSNVDQNLTAYAQQHDAVMVSSSMHTLAEDDGCPI